MIYLTIEEVLILHSFQIENFGGTDGIRDLSLLESALFRPQTTFDGKDLYKTTCDKAAVLATSTIKNHPFFDGNKRTGMHAALTFLVLNKVKIKISDKALVKLALDIANGTKDVKTVSETFKRLSADL